jgi:hypothetical protein
MAVYLFLGPGVHAAHKPALLRYAGTEKRREKMAINN